MVKFLRLLLLIALCVQLPLASLAAYASDSHYAPHQSSAVHEDSADHHRTAHTNGQAPEQEAASATADCAAVHHCAGAHLQALCAALTQVQIGASAQSFGLTSDSLLSSSYHNTIERPQWASI